MIPMFPVASHVVNCYISVFPHTTHYVHLCVSWLAERSMYTRWTTSIDNRVVFLLELQRNAAIVTPTTPTANNATVYVTIYYQSNEQCSSSHTIYNYERKVKNEKLKMNNTCI